MLANLYLLVLLRMWVLGGALLSLKMLLLLLLKPLLGLGLGLYSLSYMLLGLGLLLGLLLLWLLQALRLDLTCHSGSVTLNPLQKPETKVCIEF